MFSQPVDSVWFVGSLSDFTKMCYENNTLNRFEDSLAVFNDWIDSNTTKNIRDFRLILTHADELEEMHISPETISFLKSNLIPHGNAKEIIDGITAKYQLLDKNNRLTQVSVINCTDTEQIRDYLTTTLNSIIDGR